MTPKNNNDNWTHTPSSKFEKKYIRFKHRVRRKLPSSVRFTTVCRKCKKSRLSKKCLTCQIDQASDWDRPY